MAWIESHDDVGDHHKTQKLCTLLGIETATAVGHLHLLWHYTLRVAWQNGNLIGQTPEAIARACWYRGDPNKLVESLRESGFLNGMLVNDWIVYAREYIYQRTRYKNKRCKSAVITPEKQPEITPEKSIPPYLTLPNHKDMCIFESLWKKYPSKIGMKLALKHFCASVKTEEDVSLITKALDNYCASERVKKGFIQNGSTWFNNWKDWINETNQKTKQRGDV